MTLYSWTCDHCGAHGRKYRDLGYAEGMSGRHLRTHGKAARWTDIWIMVDNGGPIGWTSLYPISTDILGPAVDTEEATP